VTEDGFNVIKMVELFFRLPEKVGELKIMTAVGLEIAAEKPVEEPVATAKDEEPPPVMPVNCEPSIAGSFPEESVFTSWLTPLNVLPCNVTELGLRLINAVAPPVKAPEKVGDEKFRAAVGLVIATPNPDTVPVPTAKVESPITLTLTFMAAPVVT
jgi:hypothetical protein